MVRIMIHMKEQFFQTFPTQSDRDDISMKSQASQGSFDLDMGTRFECLAGESQDTEILALNEPMTEDLWNSMLALMEGRCKGKSHAP